VRNYYGTAVRSRVAIYEFESKQSLPVGHAIYLIHNEPNRIRIRSRFWPGTSNNPSFGLKIANVLPGTMVSGLEKRSPEEMAIIATVLPRLWREISEEEKAGAQTSFEKQDAG
jgi:hypothetical protein